MNAQNPPFSDWIGRVTEQHDTVCEMSIRKFRATLGPYLLDTGPGEAPPGFHWTLFAPLAETRLLGADGHPPRGGDLPPVPLESRMWAGGQLTLHGLLKTGDVIERRSHIRDITEKNGSDGRLVFLYLAHELRVKGSLVISEEQTIVYRNRSGQIAAPKPAQNEPAGRPFRADPPLLFRYSALTFNAHRIHYDEPYARAEEGYPGLVVHGPLQATLLLNAAAMDLNSARLGFQYRAMAPLYANETAGYDARAGEVLMLGCDGRITMRGTYNSL